MSEALQWRSDAMVEILHNIWYSALNDVIIQTFFILLVVVGLYQLFKLVRLYLRQRN